MSDDCPDNRRMDEIRNRLQSLEDRSRTMETAIVELRQIALNQERIIAKLDSVIERHDVTLFGDGERLGTVAKVANVIETQASWKKQLGAVWGALLTAIVGVLATFFGSKH